MTDRVWAVRGGRYGAEFVSDPYVVRWSPVHSRWVLLACTDQDRHTYRRVGNKLFTSSKEAKAAAA